MPSAILRKQYRSAVLAGAVILVGLLHSDGLAQERPDHPGTTVQLPTFGVAIDAAGVLELRAFPDPGGRLRAERMAEARRHLPPDLVTPSRLRKVSLPRLERALRERLDAGEIPDEEMLYLAGLQRVQYVICLPERGDVILAGPAEGFVRDASGRPVGMTSGQPVVHLADVAAALRVFPPQSGARPFLGCTISPRGESLSRLTQFQQTIPRFVSMPQRAAVTEYVARGMQESLGQAEIRVFGVSPRTRFAQVLLEADYRMKRIGIGLEQRPVPMTTFLDALDSARHGTLQRWWFTPDYECLRVADDRLAVELVGRSVQLRSEDHRFSPGGARTPQPRVGRANQVYSHNFTSNYPAIARRVPVYAELRNLVDLSVIAAVICHFDYYGQVGWTAETLRDEGAFAIEVHAVPRSVPCVVNATWKGQRLLAVAGGVSIQPDQALNEETWLPEDEGSLAERNAIAAEGDAESWWWD